MPEAEVIAAVRDLAGRNPYPLQQDFGNSYSGIPHPVTHQLDELMRGTYFVEWAEEQQTGTLAIERQAARGCKTRVRMTSRLSRQPRSKDAISPPGTL